MIDLANNLLFIGVVLIISGFIWERLFYQKHGFLIDEVLFTPPVGAAMIPPHIKHALKFNVPKSVRTDESGEVMIEYVQGVYHPLMIGKLFPFLYETLEMPNRIKDNLRGLFFSSTRVSNNSSITSELTEDFGARLSSSRFTFAPTDWVIYKKGLRTPQRWRWSISCNELGRYNIVIELNEAFRSVFTKELSKAPQVIFDIEVRSPIGLTLRSVTIIKYIAIALGSIFSAVTAFIYGMPYLQTSISNILQKWIP